jgi:predicted restriction endonuclease
MRYDRLNPNIQNSKGTGKARYAPHKPLLLLCIIDLAEAGELDPPLLFKTPGLRLRFDAYWSICQPRWGGLPGLDLPFHHLSSQHLWYALTKEGTPSRGPRSTHHLQLTDEFVADLSDVTRRDQIRRQLVETWFPEIEQRALYSALGFTTAKLNQIEWHEAPDTGLESTGRDARFRVTVVTQYRFTCALTGYGLHTQQGHALVEAAHIVPSPPKGHPFQSPLWGQRFALTISALPRYVISSQKVRITMPTTAWRSPGMRTGCLTAASGRFQSRTKSTSPTKSSKNGAPKPSGSKCATIKSRSTKRRHNYVRLKNT